MGERLKPYFKTRPRGPAQASSTAPTAVVAQAGQPAVAEAPAQRVAPVPPRANQAPSVTASTAATAGPPASDQTLAARRELLAAEFNSIQLDLGGLVYEMAIRDSFRLDVLTRQAARLQAVDAELARAEGAPAPISMPARVCPGCSTPIVAGAAFCAGCGRSLAAPSAATSPPVSGASR